MDKIENNVPNHINNLSDIGDIKKCRTSEKKVRFQLPEIPDNFINTLTNDRSRCDLLSPIEACRFKAVPLKNAEIPVQPGDSNHKALCAQCLKHKQLMLQSRSYDQSTKIYEEPSAEKTILLLKVHLPFKIVINNGKKCSYRMSLFKDFRTWMNADSFQRSRKYKKLQKLIFWINANSQIKQLC